MLLVDIAVRRSPIHGLGLFALKDIPKGTDLWEFSPPDSRIAISEANSNDFHFGYINPENPDFVVGCGDFSKFWNFGIYCPNCGPSDKKRLGEYVIIALVDIGTGDELLISTKSDFDSKRKLFNLWPTDLEQQLIPS
jgi:hypothetical protein